MNRQLLLYSTILRQQYVLNLVIHMARIPRHVYTHFLYSIQINGISNLLREVTKHFLLEGEYLETGKSHITHN